MVPKLETERLWLKPLAITDAPRIQQLFPAWEVVQHLAAGVPWPYPADGAERYLADSALPKMALGEEWAWSLRLKTRPEELIGIISLATGEVNRGFWLGVPWQRQGLMSEAAERVTAFWFDDLGFDRLRIPKAITNEGSRKISERSGMRVIATGKKEFVCGELDYELWELTRKDWLAHTAKSKSK